jgi:hypothetical protein
LRISATITYRTTDLAAPGQAASPHQCLRQLGGDEIDRQTILRMCRRDGAMTLAWDPPDRWRMDVSSVDADFAFVSTPEAMYFCRGDGAAVSTCVARSSDDVEAERPFRFIFLSPAHVLDQIGLTASRTIIETFERTVARIPTECFLVRETGREWSSVQWCYSAEGILLSFRNDPAGDASTTLDAVEVSGDISEADFLITAG